MEITGEEMEITIIKNNGITNFEYTFCYMIDARAKLGKDHETGNDCEIYAQITRRFEKEVPMYIQEEMPVLYGQTLAEQMGINPEYIHPISIEEYNSHVS